VTSPTVAPRGESSARKATLDASTTLQPDVRPFPPPGGRGSRASPPSSHPQQPPACRRRPLPQPPAKGNPYSFLAMIGVLLALNPALAALALPAVLPGALWQRRATRRVTEA
jgi:hypothetical protein